MPAFSAQQAAAFTRGLVRPGRLRWPLAPALALCLIAVLAGLAWPVARPPLPPAAADADWLAEPPPAGAGGEDLSAFLASERWGISLAEAERAGAASPPPAAGINPALAALGFVGVTAIGEVFAALVVVDGATVRLRAGDALVDGQTLAAIDANTATLRAPSGEERVLVLFPPVSTP